MYNSKIMYFYLILTIIGLAGLLVFFSDFGITNDDVYIPSCDGYSGLQYRNCRESMVQNRVFIINEGLK